jgi:hypothetical protein
MSKADSRSQRAWWPTLDDAASAKAAVRTAAWFAVFVGSVTALITILNLAGVTNNFMGYDAWAFLDAGTFLFLSVFMFRMSRVASILALALYIAERIAALANGGHEGVFVAVVFTLALVHGVRGAFAWRRFTRAISEGPTQPTSEPILP